MKIEDIIVKYFFFLGVFCGIVGPVFDLQPDALNLLLINAIFVAAGEFYSMRHKQ